MSNRRVSLPVALAIPQQFPSRLSPPSPASPAVTRRSLPTSPICRRSLPSTPRTISPRRLNNLLPDVDEHFASTSSRYSTSSSSENSPRRVKKRRPPPRYQYSLQQTSSSMMHQNNSEDVDDDKPEGTLRSFHIKNGHVTDNGYKQMNTNNQPVISHNYKDRRATCPEVWLFQETSNIPMQHIVLRIYGTKNCGKKTLLNSINQYATKLVTRYNNDESSDSDENSSKTLNFLLNNEQIELEMLLESTLENSPFASSLTMYAVVYNVDSRESFIIATDLMSRILNRKIARGNNIILVGNKIDLKRNTVVSKMEGACLAKVHKCNFVEVSAQYSMNISELWTLVLKQLQSPKHKNGQKSGAENVDEQDQEGAESMGWMHRIVTRGKQLAHSAEQIVQKFL